jgi:asparagine synthase (glutamine-hydrolysing)
MCGLAGFLAAPGRWDSDADELTRRMCERIRHRGPDDAGTWLDGEQGIALGHRRLSIVDTSPAGHQPMRSAGGRYVVVYNGEIYNHRELRAGLEPQPWRGHSDTETLLACFERDGIVSTLERLVGMFAIAVWDRQLQELTLARDRMGEKPLYYGTLASGDFVFGSELRALAAHPRWQGEIDPDAIADLLQQAAVPAPRSIFKRVYKLEPGCWLTRTRAGTQRQGRYWSLIDVAQRGLAQAAGAPAAVRSEAADRAAVDRLDALLGQAVRGQLEADVPVGAFLSGGVDSSAVVALMCRHSTSRVRSFSIGFTDPGFNEAEFAKAVARHLGTEHTEHYVSNADALAVVGRLPTLYDEPFADASQVPTFLVSEMARRHVTVALSGDAGDELFAGYNRYRLAARTWRLLERVPLPLRALARRCALALPPALWDRLFLLPNALLPRQRRIGNAGDKVHKFATSVMAARTPLDMYESLLSHWNEAPEVVRGSAPRAPRVETLTAALGPQATMVERMSLADQLGYLPDDILAKVDRAAMAVSLETRVPLLDHRVVEHAWTVPEHQKIRDGQTKWLLRQLLYRHVPRELIDRPKQGFAVPLDQWLRGPLRPWAEDLLAPASLETDGHFDGQIVRARWQQHLSGRRNWQYSLWNVLMFQAWRREAAHWAALA